MTTTLSSTPSSLPKIVVLDKDGVLTINSKDPNSPLYHVKLPEHVYVKDGVKDAIKLLRELRVPMVLATKQRWVVDDATREMWQAVADKLDEVLSDPFNGAYVEVTNPTKAAIFAKIATDYSDIQPSDIWVFDDSEDEVKAAREVGFTAFQCTDLHHALLAALNLR